MTAIDPATPLSEAATVVYDIEMTGLDPTVGHRICEAALIRYDGDREAARLSTLFNPRRPLDPRAAAVNGLTDDELAAAVPFAAYAPLITALFHNAVRIAHSRVTDDTFLRLELAACGFALTDGPAFDTLTLARRLRLSDGSYGLAALAARFGLQQPAHRALADALTLRELWVVIRSRLARLGILTIGDTLRFERGLLPHQPEPNPPPELAPYLADGSTLTIIYSSRSTPTPTARRIRPLDMALEERGKPAVRAFCYLRQDIRVFALHRISAYLPPGADVTAAVSAAAERPRRMLGLTGEPG
jgi:DNA polymerase III subunit epsilon